MKRLGAEHQICYGEVLQAGHPFYENMQLLLQPEVSVDEIDFSWESNFMEQVEHKAMQSGLSRKAASNAVHGTCELLYNAADHGADFGRKGEVSVLVLASRHGVFSVINDPGEGVSVPEITESTERVLPFSQHPESFRGQGGRLLTEPSFRLNYQKTRSAFQSLLFSLPDLPDSSEDLTIDKLFLSSVGQAR